MSKPDKRKVCRCIAYPFSHRLFSGDCYGEREWVIDKDTEQERLLDERDRAADMRKESINHWEK